MRSWSRLLVGPLVAALFAVVGCGPQQEYNSTDTVKTQPVPLPPRPANANKPTPVAPKSASAKPSNL